MNESADSQITYKEFSKSCIRKTKEVMHYFLEWFLQMNWMKTQNEGCEQRRLKSLNISVLGKEDNLDKPNYLEIKFKIATGLVWFSANNLKDRASFHLEAMCFFILLSKRSSHQKKGEFWKPESREVTASVSFVFTKVFCRPKALVFLLWSLHKTKRVQVRNFINSPP